MPSSKVAAYYEFLRASPGGLRVKFLNPRFHAGYLASPVAIPTVQNNAFVEDDRFKLSSFLDIPGEFGQFLSRKLREERSEWMRLEGITH
jgi:hypothetical protein